MYLGKCTELIKFIPLYSCTEDPAIDKNAGKVQVHHFCSFSLLSGTTWFSRAFKILLSAVLYLTYFSSFHNPQLSDSTLYRPITAPAPPVSEACNHLRFDQKSKVKNTPPSSSPQLCLSGRDKAGGKIHGKWVFLFDLSLHWLPIDQGVYYIHSIIMEKQIHFFVLNKTLQLSPWLLYLCLFSKREELCRSSSVLDDCNATITRIW